MELATYIALTEAAFNAMQQAFTLLKDASNGVKHTPEQLNDLGQRIHDQSVIIQQLRGMQD